MKIIRQILVLKFVKPYTPSTPTIDNPQNTAIDVTVNAQSGESTAVQYAIFEILTSKYVQANGTLAASAVWQTLGTSTGKWGKC